MKTRWITFGCICLGLGVLAGCSSGSRGQNNGDASADAAADASADSGAACSADAGPQCQYGDEMTCTNGVWTLLEDCPNDCVDPFGCVYCAPGGTFCDKDVVMLCDLQGASASEYMNCADFSTTCKDGECQFADPCVKAEATKSNIGCEYWAADLDNASNFSDYAASAQFAVAVANIGGDATAHVTVEINAAPQGETPDLQTVEAHDVAPLDLYTFLLPRRDVDGDNPPVHEDTGPQTWLSSRAFRITSDVPVVAYQFNTLDQAYSNDASLLLPKSGLGKDYLVLGYPPSGPVDLPGSPKNRGYVTILGTEDTTTVSVTPSYDILNGPGVDEVATGVGIQAGTTRTFTIGPFDVLNLETILMKTLKLPDLTGTIVTSDKPVAVFFGTDLSVIATNANDSNACCAEHLEKQVFPSFAMGQKFVVSHSAQRNNGAPEADYYRIMAYDTATVTTSLPAPNNAFTLAKGKFHEFYSTTGFTMSTSDGYLHVAQFEVVGTDIVSPIAGAGDPNLLYVPPVEQRRGLYVFTTGEKFQSNWAVISMPKGTPAMIDGKDVATTCKGPLDDGVLDNIDYVEWTCRIADGSHLVHSGSSVDHADVPIAVFVYGYYQAGSYGYPAGSDLRKTNPVVVE